MSKQHSCPIAKKGIDDVLATKLGLDPNNMQVIANLRGTYEDRRGPLDLDNLDKAAKELQKFRKKERLRREFRKISNNTDKLGRPFRELKKAFPNSSTRDAVIDAVSNRFSTVVDNVMINLGAKGIEREAYIEGIKNSNGSTIGGENHIFSIVFNDFEEELKDIRGMIETINNELITAANPREIEDLTKELEENKKLASIFSKMLDNFGSVVTFARVKLKDTEGIILNNHVSYMANADESSFSEEDISALYDFSEEKREFWQEQNERRDAYSTVSKPVRRALAKLLTFEYNDEGHMEVAYDELGYPKHAHPSTMHQLCMEILRGMQSSKDMMRILESNADKYHWLKDRVEGQGLISMLTDDPKLRTQFYKNMKKNFQKYSIMSEDVKGGVATFKTWVLNKADDTILSTYITNIKKKKNAPGSSLFTESGKINKDKLQEAVENINEYLGYAEEGAIRNANGEIIGGVAKILSKKPGTFKDMYTTHEKASFIAEILIDLNIPYDMDTIESIIRNRGDFGKLRKALLDAAKYGISESKIFQKADTEIDTDAFIADRGPSNVAGEEGMFLEKIRKVTSILSKHSTQGKRMKSKCKYVDTKGNSITMNSDINPSYMADTIETVKAFYTRDDAKGLRKWIEDHFLNCPSFATKDENGNLIILSPWVKDLYDSVKVDGHNYSFKPNSFAENFDYDRFLGENKNPFENFSSKKHAISVLAKYFTKEGSEGGKFCNIPTFILGDSGVAKFIKVKRYSTKGEASKKEVIDSIYKIYLSDRRTKEALDQVNAKLAEDGYKPIQNLKEVPEHGLLKFLEDPKYKSQIEGSENSEEVVKRVIEQYLNDYTRQTIDYFRSIGVLEYTEKDGKKSYTYLESFKGKNETVEEAFENFCWNYKLNMLSQLQFFTVSPVFYKNTKDLQKRFKEQHAPGEELDVYAVEREYGKNCISEKCVYFTDIKMNTEDVDPMFMEAIAHQFAAQGGKNSAVYEAYMEASLTDGQGYRSLDSYRKVQKMAGMWTYKMDYAYDEIKQLEAMYENINSKRREQGLGPIDITIEDRKKIESLAVVFQPIKPFLYTLEKYPLGGGQVARIPVQHKYAEIALIPILLPVNSKLRAMAEWMQEKNIDLLAATSAVKNGGFGDVSIEEAKDANSLHEVLNKGFVHELEYADYRIQGNVPEHTNTSRMLANQIKKLIFARIDKAKNYAYMQDAGLVKGKFMLNGTMRNVNGNNILAFYNALLSCNIIDSVKAFIGKVKDPTKLSKSFIQNVINNSRESMDNIMAYSLDENGEFSIPLFEGAFEHDSSANILSMLRKEVGKQMINGGSAVQASALGITGYEESENLKFVTDPTNSNNIVYVESEMPFDFSYTDENGNSILLDYDTYVNPDGTVKLSDVEVDITKPENKIYASYTKDGKYYIPKIEVDYPNILSVISYRIPTERHYSMLNTRVVRFSSRTAGGIIKLPLQATVQAGFDFD